MRNHRWTVEGRSGCDGTSVVVWAGYYPLGRMKVENRLPSLIQRIRFCKEPDEHRTGVDRFFEFDYMGSSEFEWGSLPRALKLMREAKTKAWKVEHLHVCNVDAYFVGQPKDLEIALQLLCDQLAKQPRHRTKEVTSIRVSYGLDNPSVYGIYDGWWAIDAGRWTPHGKPATDSIPFVIFRQEKHAKAWLGAM